MYILNISWGRISSLFNKNNDSSLSSDDENYDKNNKSWIVIESNKGSDEESDQVEEEESYVLQEGVFEAVAAEELDYNNDDGGSSFPTYGEKIDISIPFQINWH